MTTEEKFKKFVDIILKSNLDLKDKIEILQQEKETQEETGEIIALKYGSEDTITKILIGDLNFFKETRPAVLSVIYNNFYSGFICLAKTTNTMLMLPCFKIFSLPEAHTLT